MNGIEERFRLLAVEWRTATGHLSSIQRRVDHPAYQAIIALGLPVVPLLIDDLRGSPEHWFPALVAIVGEDHAVGAGTVEDAADRWVAWHDAQVVW